MPMNSPFFLQLQSALQTLDPQDPLTSVRLKGWASFQKMGLPHKTSGPFEYLPLRELYTHAFTQGENSSIVKQDFQEAIYPECTHSYLVCVNGHLRRDLSDISALPKTVTLLSLQEAGRAYGSFLTPRLQTFSTQEQDPFALLNLIFHTEGAFLFIPPQLEIKVPIQCLHLFTHAHTEPLFASPRIHLCLGAHSTLSWITSYKQLNHHPSLPLWFNGLIDIALEEGSHLQMNHLILPERPTWHFDALRATLKQSSTLKHVSITTGSKTIRQDHKVILNGKGASATLQGIAMLKEFAQAHAHVLMEHRAPHTHTTQLFKGILSGSSRSSFEGKIHVLPEAQKTEAYQLNRHLILNDTAQAFSKPNLEIFADDVKASHGATVAQIDPIQLFYLKTRGIDEQLSKHLLVNGFCQEILTQIPHLSLSSELQQLLKTYEIE